MQLLVLSGKGGEGELRNEKQLKTSQEIFWCLFLPASRVTFQSQSLKISLNWKQRTCRCSEFNQAQRYSEMWHKTSCFWLTLFKATAKPTGHLQGASQASIAETKVFLTAKTCPGNQVTGPSDDKGSWAKNRLTIFPGIIPITTFLLYRFVSTLPCSVLKREQWATSTPDKQKIKRACPLYRLMRACFSTKAVLQSVWSQAKAGCLGQHLGVGTQTASQMPHIIMGFGFLSALGTSVPQVALTRTRTVQHCAQMLMWVLKSGWAKSPTSQHDSFPGLPTRSGATAAMANPRARWSWCPSQCPSSIWFLLMCTPVGITRHLMRYQPRILE